MEPDRSRPRRMDGSAPVALIPSIRLAPRRAIERLPSCIQNKWGKSGTPRAAVGKWQTYSLLRPRSQLFASRQYPANLIAKFFKRGIQNSASGVENDGTPRRKILQMSADRLTHASLQSVAYYGLTHRPRHGKTEPGRQFTFTRTQAESGKVAAGHACTGLINLFEFR